MDTRSLAGVCAACSLARARRAFYLHAAPLYLHACNDFGAKHLRQEKLAERRITQVEVCN